MAAGYLVPQQPHRWELLEVMAAAISVHEKWLNLSFQLSWDHLTDVFGQIGCESE